MNVYFEPTVQVATVYSTLGTHDNVHCDITTASVSIIFFGYPKSTIYVELSQLKSEYTYCRTDVCELPYLQFLKALLHFSTCVLCNMSLLLVSTGNFSHVLLLLVQVPLIVFLCYGLNVDMSLPLS